MLRSIVIAVTGILALGLLGCAGTPPKHVIAQASTTPNAVPPWQLRSVTGSRIPREVDGRGQAMSGQPVKVIGRSTLDGAGSPSVSDALRGALPDSR